MVRQKKSKDTITIVGTRMRAEPLDGPNASLIENFK